MRIPFAFVSILLICCGPAYAAGKKQPAATSSEAAQIWVSRPDGSLSCGIKEAQTLESAAQELEKAGVRAFESGKGNDGKMRAQMCGVATGHLNRFKISESDLEKAKALGFALDQNVERQSR